jgi:hypothetical protein
MGINKHNPSFIVNGNLAKKNHGGGARNETDFVSNAKLTQPEAGVCVVVSRSELRSSYNNKSNLLPIIIGSMRDKFGQLTRETITTRCLSATCESEKCESKLVRIVTGHR